MNSPPSKSRAITVPASRLARLGRLGSMTARVAGNMAMGSVAELSRGRRPKMRDLLLTPGNITRVTDQLAQMRGAAMKVGQLISMESGDFLPPELSQIMTRLRNDAHFMPSPQLRRVLNAAWGEGWQRQFKGFDVRPIAAASIGQVHRAQTRDGRGLAIKVQYEGVARSIDSDVANVGALIRMAGLLPAGFEMAPYLEEARAQLHEETDYLREGAHMARFGALLEGDTRFALPELQDDLTTQTVLAMTYVPGAPIEAAAEEDQATRDRLMGDLIDLLLTELFTFGLMQTDPNFANYRYDAETGRIVLLDFGASREIAPEIAQLYRNLLIAGLDADAEGMERAGEALRFVGPDTAPAHRAQILHMMELAFATLRGDAPFDFAGTDMPRTMQDEGTKLAEMGFIPPEVPMDVLYLQRKFGGMFLLGARLGARLPVAQMLRRHLA